MLTDSYVTAESGTGVVHQAPAFGEDDYRVCAAAGIIQRGVPITCPIDANGRFTDEVHDFVGQYIKVNGMIWSSAGVHFIYCKYRTPTKASSKN